MALVSDYDASTFVEGDWETYPPLPVGATYYQPSMYWRVSVAGTVQGQPVVADDLLFATQGDGRLYGDGLYGEQIYGGLSDGDWTVQQVYFLRWVGNRAPPDIDPFPNAGCRFTRPDGPMGDWAPGWRIVIDAFYNDVRSSRTYGQLLYGDDVYGDVDDAGGKRWVDITQPAYSITTGDGTREGEQHVVVAELVVQLIDEDGSWADFAEPDTWYTPQPGTPLRVGFIDPEYRYHPIVTAQLERVEDVHDEQPRLVGLRGFGQLMDLTVDVPAWQRPAEMLSTRFDVLATAAGWHWTSDPVVFPGDISLHADAQPSDIVVRDELDRTVQSAGWMLDTDRRGRLRVREWPHLPEGDAVTVADCVEDGDVLLSLERSLESGVDRDLESGEPRALEPADVAAVGELISHAIAYVNHEALLLNRVLATNTADPPVEALAEDELSVSRYGRRGRALGYPKTGLAFADAADADDWTRRVANRFAYITRHVERFDVDTVVDDGWLAVLADLDTGRAVVVTRRAFRPFSLDGVIVGWRYDISPGRWEAELSTSTITPTL